MDGAFDFGQVLWVRPVSDVQPVKATRELSLHHVAVCWVQFADQCVVTVNTCLGSIEGCIEGGGGLRMVLIKDFDVVVL